MMRSDARNIVFYRFVAALLPVVALASQANAFDSTACLRASKPGLVCSAKTKTAIVQVQNISAALQLFSLDVKRYPTAWEGLAVLRHASPGAVGWNGPYLRSDRDLIDPWGVPYAYRSPGQHRDVNPGKHDDFDVYTFGSDKKPGGTGEAQDIASWEVALY